MINLRRNIRFPADPQQFVDCLQQLVPFAPHVRNVFALIFRRDFAQLDQLLGLGVKRRRINQRGADPERARFHLLPDELPHLLELFRRRLFVFEANDKIADRGRADERRDVAGDAALLEVAQIFRERAPLDLVLDVALLAHDPFLHPVVERPHRISFAHDLRRHSFADFALGTAVLDQRFSRPREHVDETRRDREPLGLDHRLRLVGGIISERRDPIAADSYINHARFFAGAVVNRATFDDDVELVGCLWLESGSKRRERERKKEGEEKGATHN